VLGAAVLVLVGTSADGRETHATARVAHATPRVSVPLPTAHALKLVDPDAVRLATAGAGSCSICGAGIPDARLGAHVKLGADSFGDRLRLYVKLDAARTLTHELEVAVDVSPNAGVFVLGSRF